MLSPQQYQDILDHADAEIARVTARTRLKAGRGVDIKEGKITVTARPETGVEDELKREGALYAQERVVEVQGQRMYFNIPPIFGVEPVFDGDGIYSTPKPWAPLMDCRVWVRTTWTMTATDIPSSDEEVPAVTVGLGLGGLVSEVLLLTLASSPANDSPEAGDGEIQPYPGNYERWGWVATVIGGVVSSAGATLPGGVGNIPWGGTRQVFLPGFAEGTGLGLGGGIIYP